MKFFYITNDIEIAKIASRSGVDRIFIDLEYIGKEERQKNLDTVKSKHTLEDVQKIRKNIDGEILVRVNPIHGNSEYEISKAIEYGADYVMLPMFKTKKEVDAFIKYVNGDAKTILLFEHIEALKNIDDILLIDGIDEAYIGLNDLHLSMKATFMFELLSMDIVKHACNKFKKKSIPYGIGGIASLGEGLIPAELILTEFYNLGATRTILSRSFIKSEEVKNEFLFKSKVEDVRQLEKELSNKDRHYFDENRMILNKKIEKIVESKRKYRGE